MNPEGNGQGGPFEVSIPAIVIASIKKWHAEAVLAGAGEQFLTALRQIIHRLHRDPFNFGEALYNLPALKLHVRQAIVLPVLVNYSVHVERPIVFVRGFRGLW